MVMFFAGLTSAYIVRKSEGNWQEFELPSWFLYSFVLVILSSLFIILAKKRFQRELPYQQMILVSVVLGLLFSLSQFLGWKELVQNGIYFTGEGSNPSGSFLYVLTLAHLLHLIAGLIALLVGYFNSISDKYTVDDHLGLDLIFTFWHFLTILWVYLYLFLVFI